MAVMQMLSVVTLMDLTLAHVKLDFPEMAKVVLLQVSGLKKTEKFNVFGLKTIKTSHLLSLSASQNFS